MSWTTPTLNTPRLYLRPFEDSDAEALFAMHSNVHVLRFWDSPPWSDSARAATFIEGCRLMADEGSGIRLAVEVRPEKIFIGWVSLTRWKPEYHSAAMGYCFDEEHWGKGFATEATRALLQWAFSNIDLNRVQAETDTRNTASAGVLEKLGFTLEGTLREDCVVDGVVSDSWVFGLLRRDWESNPEPIPAR